MLRALIFAVPVWMDVDPAVMRGGHEPDDGLALLQAFHSDELEVRGVSVVFGNSPLDTGYPIAREIARRFGPEDLSVFRGASSGRELGEETDASRALAEALMREELSVLALGPVTNVATVLKNHPELARQIRTIVAVAGRRPGQKFVLGEGGTPLMDFNFELDPEGFRILLASGVPLALAPFEISSKTPLTEGDIERFASVPEVSDFYLEPLRDYLKWYEERFGLRAIFPFDTLAVAYLTSPDWIQCDELPVAIETHPDDVRTGGTKPYLLAGNDVRSPYRARYCHTASPEFIPDLMKRMLGRWHGAMMGPSMLGETIGHYRLTDRLGAGAMGEVYLAEDTRLHRPVALKMLPVDAGEDQAAAARLVREARVASALAHPNIAVIYEIGEVEREGRRHGFIAMEYVPGRTLAQIASERQLEVGEILAIARQVADALVEAHERGVVHRDIKPGNVMMTDRGFVKVLDFGLAKYAPAGSETATWSGAHRLLEQPGAVVGTLAYMSPEQARGGVVDERSDVFSLGVLLYELLEGRRPFEGPNAVELLDTILREPPSPLVGHEGPLARELGRVVLRMLEKERERRHPDMSAVRRDLEALLSGLAPAVGASASDTPSIAVTSFTNITRGHDDDWLGTGIAETVTSGLASVPELTVVSRARVVEVLRKLGGTEGNEEALGPRLGRELGVRLLVSGGYQRLTDQVRVTARVTDLTTGTAIQTLKLDGSMVGIFDLQDRILGELSAGLRLHLPASAAKNRDLYETHSVEAYEAFAKGLINLRAESPDALDRAILYFERSVAVDPDYASAHTQRGLAYELKADYLSMPELYEKALASLERALVLCPGFVQAHRSRASVLLTLGREEEAVTAVERALALDPGAASGYQTLGRIHFIGFGDFARAAEYFEKALALNPQAGWAALQLAHCRALLGDSTRAEAAAWRAVLLQEEFLSGREGQLIVGAYVRLGQAFAVQGRYDEALHQFERELEFLRRVDHALRSRIFIELHQRIGDARIRTGDAAGGRAALDLAIEAFERRLRTGADDPFTRYYAACAYALRGDTEAALESLQKAAASRRLLTVARARVEPALESLRPLERFQALLDATS